MPQPDLSLSLISEHRILDKGAGLNEPSGLALNHDGTALYTVSDDTKAVFQLDLKGRLSITDSFCVGLKDLEGIAISVDGSQLFTVQEDTNSIISIDLPTRQETSRRPLAAMQNFDRIESYFPNPRDNKGLEGITVNSRTNELYVVKEGRPGLLIAIDPSQHTILESRLLTPDNGFSHPKLDQKKLDFSGLSYDTVRDTIWITSDKGQCLFHYDWAQDLVLQRLDLRFKVDGEWQTIRKSEGVAIDPKRGRLYVVSERDGRLYVLRINSDG